MRPIFKSGRIHSRKLAALILGGLAIAVELHQRLEGYSFNMHQILDTKLHHEHFILAFAVATILTFLSIKRQRPPS